MAYRINLRVFQANPLAFPRLSRRLSGTSPMVVPGPRRMVSTFLPWVGAAPLARYAWCQTLAPASCLSLCEQPQFLGRS
ncbi:hypothetical protein L211DRAFT_833465 [Terfezia boudieri ATCC MYA-4762]|uniref:Uncharacterized protein n=1 Tax=Terfezia boudieri ATCC MYA-4762 TaxID=1051890 RepID=A0A3N4M638_9PEZI|nr:hypothetical protein L211DRAFT_833465 [Terfezia boudieri ATCC MYA-4762]